MSIAGQRKSHESAIGHVTGKAVYTDDQRLPAGMLSLYPVVSPHAHARILKVDTSAALGVEGVVTVLTPKDIPGKNDTGAIRNDEPLMPTDEVSYWGQPVVWVVGESDTAARLGAEQIKIEYEHLPAILSIPEAIEAQSFHSAPDICTRGNVLRAFDSADHVLEGEVAMNGQDHFYLETQAAWVVPDTEGNFQVYSSTQHPSSTQHTVADVLTCQTTGWW
jgi:xanthine dehydrogenase large subunit